MYSAQHPPPPQFHPSQYAHHYDYLRTPPVSPSPNTHGYYSPRYSSQTATPSPRASPNPKGHSRRASHEPPLYSYASPRAQPFYGRYASPQAYAQPQSTPRRDTDYVPIYTAEDSTPHRSRARRNSHTTRTTPQPAPPKPKPSHAKSTPQATEEDARRANIPAGYSYKNWDPAEEPILLLGSVFDANSLGKWIYDWTVFVHARASPMAEVAGELWLLLIQLAGKVKRAEETMQKIRKKESREMVEDFLESGERLWSRFGKLLKVCEEYMWKAAKETTGAKKPLSMGMNSGVEFVDSMFGRDRELERTEKLMTAMRLWSMRFDANCEEILRHPSA